MLAKRFNAFQRPAPEVQKRLVGQGLGQALQLQGVLLRDQLTIGFEPDDMLGKQAEHRRFDARRSMPLERVNKVFGKQLARAFLGKLPGRALVAELFAGQMVVQILALGVLRESRVRGELQARPDRDFIDALRDRFDG